MSRIRKLVSAFVLLVAVSLPTASSGPSGGDIDLPEHIWDKASANEATSTLEARQASSYDIIILGATPGGITTALSASRVLQDVNKPVTILILERSKHIGGLPANGLGATDIKTRGATGGLFLEFVNRVKSHYISKYGADSKEVKDCSNGFHFEPSVAEKVFNDMVNEENGRVLVKMEKQFDAKEQNLEYDAVDGRVRSIAVKDLKSGTMERYLGKYFIDASYEGDLIAAAKIPFFVGRESEDVYAHGGVKEIGAGKVYKYWGGEEAEGTTHQGDNTTQAFNYRLCLTNSGANMAPITKPATYNRNDYVSIIKDIVTGCYTSKEAAPYCRRDLPAGDSWKTIPPTDVAPGAPKGIVRLTNMVTLPNGKNDANNQHMTFISTDLPVEIGNTLPQIGHGETDSRNNDPEVPVWFRQQVTGWGLSKDEYTDNNNFPRQVYVREGRRMHDTLKWDSITASHYALDSHAVRKREPNRAHLDGFVSYIVPKPYTVPIGVMVPGPRTDGKPVKNLLAPVPASASHIGFSTLRMEPCWMALGQAAGMVVGLFLKDDPKGVGSVRNIDVPRVQNALLDRGAVLVYSSDLAGKSAAEKKKIQVDALKKARRSNRDEEV
ncbi:FAD dependent oxidoreductase-domain-containing protein [Kalaharituber pfeilii]|nr:FAD dependent oxidoreductase-domain-containing protein [Kalaharituber pfeilii]